jgi:hypothetical protein
MVWGVHRTDREGVVVGVFEGIVDFLEADTQ